MCVVVPSGLLCPNKPTAPLPNPVPLLRQRLRKPPPPLLLVVTSVPCSSDNCWDVWSSHLCSVLFLSLTPCRSPFQKSLLQLFLSLNIKKKKKSLRVKSLHIFFLSPTPVCGFSSVHSRFIWLDKRSREVIDRKKAKETGWKILRISVTFDGSLGSTSLPTHSQIKQSLLQNGFCSCSALVLLRICLLPWGLAEKCPQS